MPRRTEKISHLHSQNISIMKRLSSFGLFAFILTLSLYSCKTSKTSFKIDTNSQARQLLQKTLQAHGGKLYDQAHYQFVFRDKAYTFKNNGGLYYYTARYKRENKSIFDQMDNSSFSRTIDGIQTSMTANEQERNRPGLNSVIYFATLPHKLVDPAVNLDYLGETQIKSKSYEVLQVAFDEEGGGKDHEDVYHYWINKDTGLIDYLAYNYRVNKGGVRFRSAYNTRRVAGIVFQDYINYKADVGTPLIDLPVLYEAGQLKELSRIETESVKAL